jgi:transposase
MTIVEDRPSITGGVDTHAITGGVDTHADTHVAAALDSIGGLLGVREFPATAAGYASLLSWLRSFGTLAVVGVEGTGSYGAGLARYLAAAGVRVVEAVRLRPPGPGPAGQVRPAGCGQRRAGGAVGEGVGGTAGP